MKQVININSEKFKERFANLKLEDLQITLDNITRLDDLNELKQNGNLRQEIVQKLLLLTDDNYTMALDRLESIPNFKLESLLDNTLDANKMESLLRIAYYCHAAEFGDLKDRGKQFMNNEELSNLISLHSQLTNNQINVIGSALNEDLDYHRLIHFAQSSSNESQFFDELQHLRQNKVHVLNLLEQNGYNHTEISPERLRHLFQSIEKPSFDLQSELVSPLNNNLVYREINTNTDSNQESIGATERALYKIIQQLNENPDAWHKTWQHVAQAGGLPVNPITGTEYSGLNFISLAISQSNMKTEDPRWCSFKQAQTKGYQVNKGSKSPASVLFFSIKHEFTIAGAKFANGSNKLSVTGKSNSDTLTNLASTLTKSYPNRADLIISVVKKHQKSGIDKVVDQLNQVAFGAPVLTVNSYVIDHCTPMFNYSQLQNVPELVNKETKPKWQPCVQADTIVQAMTATTGLQIKNDSFDRCGYRDDTNTIHMVNPVGFKNPESYYSALLHEVAHARMREPDAIQELRLTFNPELYHVSINERAKEELRAELCAVFTCAKIGLGYNLENHTAYLDSWLQEFKENPRELLHAASEANRVSNSILTRTHEYVMSNSIDWKEFRQLELCEVKNELVVPSFEPKVDEVKPLMTNTPLEIIDSTTQVKEPEITKQEEVANEELEPEQTVRRRR